MYGGVKACESERYDNLREGVVKGQKADAPWWQTPWFNCILVVAFSFMDGLVLFSVFDACMVQGGLMSWVMALGIALVLNSLPLLIARFLIETVYKIRKKSVIMLIICITGFLLIFAGTVILRFAYRDMYGETKQAMQLENTVSNENTIEETSLETQDDSKGIAVVLLLSASPLVTSIIAFAIAFITDDVVKKKYEFYEVRSKELDEGISDLEAAKATMDNNVERELLLDEGEMRAAINEVYARAELLKSLAEKYHLMYMEDPVATSIIKANNKANKESGDRDNGDKEPVVFNGNIA